MNKMKSMREAADAKVKQAKLAAEHLPKGLSIAKDIVSQCGEIMVNTMNLVGILSGIPDVDLDALKEATNNLRDASSNTKELINSLKEILNELKTAFNTDGDKKKEKMSKVEKGIYRIDRVVQESMDVVDVTVEIVELVQSIVDKLQQGSKQSWNDLLADVKEKSEKLVKEVKEMKDAFLGKDEEDNEAETKDEMNERKEKKESKKIETQLQSKPQEFKKPTIVVDDVKPEEKKSCWSNIFCCC